MRMTAKSFTRLILILLLFSNTCFLLVGCNRSKETEEPTPDELMVEEEFSIGNCDYIAIYSEFNMNDEQYIIKGQLKRKSEDSYILSAGNELIDFYFESEFTKQTFENALEKINISKLTEYEPKVDELGKKEYETIPLCLEVHSNMNRYTYKSFFYPIEEKSIIADYFFKIIEDAMLDKYPLPTNEQCEYKYKRVFDFANQFTDEQTLVLEQLISFTDFATSGDVVIVTLDMPLKEYAENLDESVKDNPIKYVAVYADKFWKDNKFGYDAPFDIDDPSKGDGIIIVDNSFNEPTAYTKITTYGDTRDKITNQEMDYILNNFLNVIDENPFQAYVNFLKDYYYCAIN